MILAFFFYSHKDPDQLICVIHRELSKIPEWLKVNNLSLKVAKTNYILFRPRHKPITVSDTITLDNIALQQAEVTMFLGILLDQHLSWKCHVSHVARNFLCTHLVITSFLILLTSPLLLISQSSIWDLNYGTPYPIILRN